VLDGQRRVFRLGRVQGVRSFLRLVVGGRADGQPEHRPWQVDRLQVEVIFIVRIVQHSVVMYFVDPRNGADIAGQGDFDFCVVPAVEL
jgi:hypothetical protein